MKIGIIGAGNVGRTLGSRWLEAGHSVRYGVRDAGSGKYADLFGPDVFWGSGLEAAEFSDVVVFSTPWKATLEAVAEAGNLDGKVVLDCVNAINPDFSGLELKRTDSVAERIATAAPKAKVVKIFNTVGFNIMANPDFDGQPATMLYCGDDVDAKATAAQLAVDIGFDPVDAGPLIQARYLEAFAWLWISMAIKEGHGREMAFRLMKR
ncbi:MAG TPA: NADPH-dependent F420 reductase [Fimbriimonadaceae bacterium]|nr:NADPH-dependent F420 reductase [Fimbriimonadaceae bacterium]